MTDISDEILKVANEYDVLPLYKLADRIDAETVELPKDADGVPIHVGDVMEWCDSGETLTVEGIGSDVLFYIDGENAEWTAARNKRHRRVRRQAATEGEQMSITEELREYVQDWRDAPSLMYDLDRREVEWILADFIRIADRIDAEHESACAEAYGNGVMSVPIALDESAWVELPKDADGEPIHIGDVMDSKVDYLFDGKPFTVRALVLCKYGWEVADGRFGNRYKPDSLRHHHAPTVEDVLREFADEMNQNLGMYTGEAIDADEWRDADAKTVEKFAAKLRLAGENA